MPEWPMGCAKIYARSSENSFARRECRDDDDVCRRRSVAVFAVLRKSLRRLRLREFSMRFSCLGSGVTATAASACVSVCMCVCVSSDRDFYAEAHTHTRGHEDFEKVELSVSTHTRRLLLPLCVRAAV